MRKYRIPRKISERCLLTEVSPFETPIPYSNWGSFNYWTKLQKKCNSTKSIPKLIREIFNDQHGPIGEKHLFRPITFVSVPFKYTYRKDIDGYRTLFLIHPGHSVDIVNLYKYYDINIIKSCQKSKFSMRFPNAIAKVYIPKFEDFDVEDNLSSHNADDENSDDPEDTNHVEVIGQNKPYASSYFVYNRFSYLHKFFESNEFLSLEKRFSKLRHFDITKFFPSIYTHSISWAIEGKHWAKERSGLDLKNQSLPLGHYFDKLMQSFNHRETAGIATGPEISRIFAEIIMQDIDSKIKIRMDEQCNSEESYYCCRYIDDFFLFYDTPEVGNKFAKILHEELEKYNLYLNKTKDEITNRPFINSIGIKKAEIITYLKKLETTINTMTKNEKIISNRKIIIELNAIRSLIRGHENEMHAFSNLYLSISLKRIRKIQTLDIPNHHMLQLLLLYIEHVFHWVQLDTRMNTINYLAKIVSECIEFTKNLDPAQKNICMNKIFSELNNVFNSATRGNHHLEAMNLLAVAELLGNNFRIDEEILIKYIDSAEKNHYDEIIQSKRLTYFSIASLLRYTGRRSDYNRIINNCIEATKKIIKHYDPRKYSESAHLFLDFIRCPFVSKKDKNDVIKICLGQSSSVQEVGEIRNFITKHDWFYDWNGKSGIKKMLKKKRFGSPY